MLFIQHNSVRMTLSALHGYSAHQNRIMSCCWFVSSFNCHFDKVKLRFVDVKKFAILFGNSHWFLLWLLLISRLSVWSISYLIISFLFCACTWKHGFHFYFEHRLSFPWYILIIHSFIQDMLEEGKDFFTTTILQVEVPKMHFFEKLRLEPSMDVLSQTLIQVNDSTH